MKTLHKSGANHQIANLMRDGKTARACADRVAQQGTPLSLCGHARASLDPRGGHPRQVSLPLCVRPYVFFKAKAVAA